MILSRFLHMRSLHWQLNWLLQIRLMFHVNLRSTIQLHIMIMVLLIIMMSILKLVLLIWIIMLLNTIIHELLLTHVLRLIMLLMNLIPIVIILNLINSLAISQIIIFLLLLLIMFVNIKMFFNCFYCVIIMLFHVWSWYRVVSSGGSRLRRSSGAPWWTDGKRIVLMAWIHLAKQATVRGNGERGTGVELRKKSLNESKRERMEWGR